MQRELQLTVRQMEYIVAVADHGSISAAARACHVSQPTLSAQIAQVEKRIGHQLFQRGARATGTTPVGAETVQRCRKALAAVAHVEAAGELADVIRLGAIDTVGPYLFAKWLKQARDEGAEQRCIPYQARTKDLIAMLDDGRLDAAVLADGTIPARFERTPLTDDPLWLIVDEHDPLADTRHPVPLDQIAGRDVLLLADGHCLRDQTVDVCAAVGAVVQDERWGMLEAATLETLVEMVAAGLGVTLVPQLALPSVLRCEQVRAVPLTNAPRRALHLAYLPNTNRETEIGEWAEHARQAIAASRQ